MLKNIPAGGSVVYIHDQSYVAGCYLSMGSFDSSPCMSAAVHVSCVGTRDRPVVGARTESKSTDEHARHQPMSAVSKLRAALRLHGGSSRI